MVSDQSMLAALSSLLSYYVFYPYIPPHKLSVHQLQSIQ